MKVLLAHNFYQQAGGEDQVFADEGRLLEAHGHQVIRYTLDNDAIESMGRLELAAKTFWNRQVYRELRELVRHEQPQIAHFQNTFPLISPAAYYAMRREGVAVVQELPNYRLMCANGLFFRDGRVCEDCCGKRLGLSGVIHRCYRGSLSASAMVTAMTRLHRATGTWHNAIDVFIALTEFGRGKFVDGGFPAAKIMVKGNFVEPDPGVGSGAGEAGKPYAVFVGRLSPEKGVDTLLSAWSSASAPGIPLKIIGDGPLAEQVRSAATAHRERIQWLGRKPMEQVLQVVGEASFLICPSRWHETGGPKTILEAFAKGTPVIASRLGIMQHVVAHEKTGLLFEAGNAEDLAAQAARLAADAGLRSQMRGAARGEFEVHYTADRNYGLLMEIYQRAQAVAGGK